jgi:hypothetical protein
MNIDEHLDEPFDPPVEPCDLQVEPGASTPERSDPSATLPDSHSQPGGYRPNPFKPQTLQEEFDDLHRMINWSRRQVWGCLTPEEQAHFGGDVKGTFKFHVVQFWMMVRPGSQNRAILNIARAIGAIYEGRYERLIAALPKAKIDWDAEIESARTQYPLVLVEGIGTRIAFWAQKPISEKLTKSEKLWALLWALAVAAETSRGIDGQTMGIGGQSAFATQKSRLAAILPSTLKKLIKNSGRNSYRLQLPPSAIKLIDRGIVVDNEREISEAEFGPRIARAQMDKKASAVAALMPRKKRVKIRNSIPVASFPD